ncbi:transglycosylase domain-containing protein [Microbacteriaceae bacterium 4G12]
MKKGIIALSSIALVCITALIGYVIIISLGNYVIDEKRLVLSSASRIVDEQGNEISKLYVENRELVPLKQIPQHVQQAFLSAEDTRFYKHHGIDMISVFRALYKDIAASEKAEGGSTITQQLAKNVFLTNEKTFWRKIKELAIAINLEHRYTKGQVLEMYLNQIYFGHGSYGIQAAAKFYFNKNVQDLTVEEGALLASLPKAPNTYSPVFSKEKSKQRRNLILSLMNKQGYLTTEETVHYQRKSVVLHIQQNKREQAYASYIDMVFREAEELYGFSPEEVLRGGYTFTVSMNPIMQKKAYELFQNKRNFPDQNNDVEGAFVVMDSKTGGIKAAIGGRNYVARGLHRVYVKRQPGSVLKPLLVYAPALETKKYKPYSLITNEQQSFDGYMPRNYNETYSKEITMYDALKESANVPAVWLLNDIGIEAGKSYLSKGDINISDSGLSAALGGLADGISPLELMKMYRAFLENGKVIEPHIITQIANQRGEVIAAAPNEETKIFSKQTAWYMTRMLEGAVKDGTAQAGMFKGVLAGKTGTTSLPDRDIGAKDAWFVGYTPTLVGAVWMGYDHTDSEHYLAGGSSYPTKLFKNILTSAHVEAFSKFSQPQGVKNIEEPIRLGTIEELQVKPEFTPFGLFTAHITWKELSDKRIQYRIYKVNGKSASLVGTVTGKGKYRVKYINVFANQQFYVVPFNPQTKQEGEKTKPVQL